MPTFLLLWKVAPDPWAATHNCGVANPQRPPKRPPGQKTACTNEREYI